MNLVDDNVSRRDNFAISHLIGVDSQHTPRHRDQLLYVEHAGWEANIDKGICCVFDALNFTWFSSAYASSCNAYTWRNVQIVSIALFMYVKVCTTVLKILITSNTNMIQRHVPWGTEPKVCTVFENTSPSMTWSVWQEVYNPVKQEGWYILLTKIVSKDSWVDAIKGFWVVHQTLFTKCLSSLQALYLNQSWHISTSTWIVESSQCVWLFMGYWDHMT